MNYGRIAQEQCHLQTHNRKAYDSVDALSTATPKDVAKYKTLLFDSIYEVQSVLETLRIIEREFNNGG